LTIAMALEEAGWFERLPIEIWGSDISSEAIDKALRGVYRERSFRSLPHELRDRHFAPHEGGWRINPALQARVGYSRVNLLAPADLAPFAGVQYVFCRNVFIYFSPATIAQVVQQIGERMRRPGYLFLAASESLLRMATEFELEEIAGAFVYVKG
jgi:chemotaxis protein methyltransferase CheR